MNPSTFLSPVFQASPKRQISCQRYPISSLRHFILAISIFMMMLISRVTSFPIRRHVGGVSTMITGKRPFTTKTTTNSQVWSTTNQNKDWDEILEGEINTSGYHRPVVQWYPGHIAKAERLLQETLKAVDVVVEVRDARIPKATSHPLVGQWAAGRPRIIVMTHLDAIPNASKQAWNRAYEELGAAHPEQAATLDRQIIHQAKQAARERLKYLDTMQNQSSNKKGPTIATPSDQAASPIEAVLYVNGKTGQGIHALTRSIFQAGSHVQARREGRGLKPRPLRVGVMGYPNVGKSALINRLLGRRRARTANMPGVTRSLQWIRVRNEDVDAGGKSNNKKDSFELLDSPGIIPATLVDQSDATLLAVCNCIGDAAYDNQAVAAYLCEWMLGIYRLGYGTLAAPAWRQQCMARYKFDPLEAKVEIINERENRRPRTGEDMLFDVADATCQGDPEDAARKILQDFRSGRMGPICLQVAPVKEEDKGQTPILGLDAKEERMRREQELKRLQQERSEAAKVKAEELGLELPSSKTSKETRTNPNEIGKGMFDGW